MFGRRQWHPTLVLLPGKSHGLRSLVGCSPWDREESEVTERLHFHFSLLCIGEGNGNPLQCSSLENPRDGVSQSQTWLKWLSSSSSNQCINNRNLFKNGSRRKKLSIFASIFFFFEKPKRSTETNKQTDKEASWLFNMTMKKNGKLLNLQAMYGKYCGLEKTIQKNGMTRNKRKELMLQIFSEGNKSDTLDLLGLGDLILLKYQF